MYDYTGWIVQATAGRDKDGIFCVVGVDQEQNRLLLADGKRRRADAPKRKKLGHVRMLTGESRRFDHSAIQRLTRGEALTNKELRRTLAAFRDQMEV